TLAERIHVLYERMLHHLHHAQTASAEEHTTLTPPITTGQPVTVEAADTPYAAGAMNGDELAGVHAVLDQYGVPRVLFSVLGPDWRAQDVCAPAAGRLRKPHRLMAESGLPDFMPPRTVVDSPEGRGRQRGLRGQLAFLRPRPYVRRPP